MSRTYIKIIRDRSEETYKLLNEIRNDLLKLLSPITPFLTEKIWQELKEKKIVKEESAHLSKFPDADKKLINKKLEEEFRIALDIIEQGLAARDKSQIGLKWPLAKAIIELAKDTEIRKELQEIIKRQLNVKSIEIRKGKEVSVKLDTEMTPELEAEGYAREISRKAQALRKNAGLVKTDKIELVLIMDMELTKLIESQLGLIKERTNSKNIFIRGISEKKEQEYKNKSEENIKGKNIKILFNKV